MPSPLLDVSLGMEGISQFLDTGNRCHISYSFPLALYSRDFTTSVVLGNDMIPRYSLPKQDSICI